MQQSLWPLLPFGHPVVSAGLHPLLPVAQLASASSAVSGHRHSPVSSPVGSVTSGGIAPAATCTPYVDGDNLHITSGEVSAHGWWYQGTCPNTKATVTIWIQEYFSDRTWHTQGSGQAYVWPGGGSSNWANARQVCEGVALVPRRALVSVNIGTGASAQTDFRNLNCTHW